MSDFIQTKYFSGLRNDLKQNIKVFYLFDNYYLKDNIWRKNGKNTLFVTKDDCVYGFGNNSYGVLGLGHNREVKEPKTISQLCNKQIIDFNTGYHHCIARSINGNVYSFGTFEWNPVGYKIPNKRNKVPQLVEGLKNENVTQVSCGARHTIVLTQNGKVFGWGDNSLGQIGICCKIKTQPTPIIIIGFNNEKIKSISCGSLHSMALTVNGNVFSWGSNDCGQLGINSNDDSDFPQIIDIKDKNVVFDKITCGYAHSILLSTNGEIYSFGWNYYKQLGHKFFWNKDKQKYPLKINFEMPFKDIACTFDKNISTAQTKQNLCYIWGKCGPEVIEQPRHINKYTTCEETILNFYGITAKAFSLWSFKNNFNVQTTISIGGYGIINKILDKSDQKMYAMKRIAFNNSTKDKVLIEVLLTKKLLSYFVIEIKNFWIEENYLLIENNEKYQQFCDSIDSHPLFKRENNLLLHIQMELCYISLRDVLPQIREELEEGQFKIKSLLSFYISSELFTEILECVDYLHSRTSNPIIHRDLKPSNILITYGMNGRFVKLADFGLSKEIVRENQSNSAGVGTFGFTAPEVMYDEPYSTKADVFSLGSFMPKIFNFSINYLNTSDIENQELKIKYEILIDIHCKMTSIRVKDRIDCEQVLAERNKWCVNIKKLIDDETFKNLMKIKDPEIETNFCSFFCHKKSKYFTVL